MRAGAGGWLMLFVAATAFAMAGLEMKYQSLLVRGQPDRQIP